MQHAHNSGHQIPPDPFLTITDLAQHLSFDQKTVKKLSETCDLPLTELSKGKKGRFLSTLNAWKESVMRREEDD